LSGLSKIIVISIAYTYNEPTIFLEYARDIMKLARKSNLKNVWVSNGYLSPASREEILPYLDAINIDLKFFQDDLYQKICGARLRPVLENITFFHQDKIHLELTTLLISELIDSDQINQMINFIKNLDTAVPCTFLVFFRKFPGN
jgi:pyruvate formate lyase activating enzyme